MYMNNNYFVSILVVCSIIVNSINRLDIGKDKDAVGVTKLRNEICVLCRTSHSHYRHVICVFEDRNPFLLVWKIEAYEIEYGEEIASCEMENCFYVSDISVNRCIWKIKRKTYDKYKFIKWLNADNQPLTLSVSSLNGRLLVISYHEAS